MIRSITKMQFKFLLPVLLTILIIILNSKSVQNHSSSSQISPIPLGLVQILEHSIIRAVQQTTKQR